jgi:hypothetical protein
VFRSGLVKRERGWMEEKGESGMEEIKKVRRAPGVQEPVDDDRRLPKDARLA